MAVGKAAVSFEYHSWINLGSWHLTRLLSVALKAAKGGQLQATVFWQVAFWLNYNFFSPINKLWKITCEN